MTSAEDINPAAISPGQALPEISVPITLQRLVMEAGANRDLSLIHHDTKVAQAAFKVQTEAAENAHAKRVFGARIFYRDSAATLFHQVADVDVDVVNVHVGGVKFGGVVEVADELLVREEHAVAHGVVGVVPIGGCG